MGTGQVIDEVIKSHGNRQGLSTGKTVVGWLSFILSESDHRPSFVEPWASRRLRTLQGVLGEGLKAEDFTDDRLGDD